jgi:hypothetical protein
MKSKFQRDIVRIMVFAATAIFVIGCGRSNSFQGDRPAKKVPHTAQITEHEHEGWWCAEHGVPEEECSQCSAKVAAELKRRGDWCVEHDCAKSQCFKCEPKLKEKYAALYRAKEGKEPPALEEDLTSSAPRK